MHVVLLSALFVTVFCLILFGRLRFDTFMNILIVPLFRRVVCGSFNKSKFYSRRNKEQIEVKEYLLSFGVEYFAFQFAIQKFKDTQNCNYSCCFVWL